MPDIATLKYYEDTCREYDRFSSSIDMGEQWASFESMLPSGGTVLDLGCGTGRDIKHFLEAGFIVEGVEPSLAMANCARSKTGAKIFDLAAEQIAFVEKYDGIWACASLMHMHKSAFVVTLPKIVRSLKPGGHFYFSLKQGFGEARNADGRLFSFYEMDEVIDLFSLIANAQIVKQWVSKDLAGRSETQWLNILVKKQSFK
ncbi:class I SAM-dependent methyltransferase [Pseudomonas sp. NFACC13-1]|uniref:class I SAM-dependent DNA methyltransferase n=1 Tax=Pseudomonas sp. NFACC13-1 TaxID=1566245 RepID=UPI0015A3EC69|nr:class I SAM-dependent methyltransferase [Pseudomonas sp. NFACC13-1]